MVMRNRHDGNNPPGWWDDLPPGIKKRCIHSPQRDTDDCDFLEFADAGPSTAIRVARDFSWLLVIFVTIAVANLLFLLVALSYLYGHGLFRA